MRRINLNLVKLAIFWVKKLIKVQIIWVLLSTWENSFATPSNLLNIASEINLSKHKISWLINSNSIRIPLDISTKWKSLVLHWNFQFWQSIIQKFYPKSFPSHDVIQRCVLVYNRANRNIFQNLIIMRMFTIFCLGDFSSLFLIHHRLPFQRSRLHIP